jgi:hypothetical protein
VSASLLAVVIDCVDPKRLADFWATALGAALIDHDRPGLAEHASAA